MKVIYIGGHRVVDPQLREPPKLIIGKEYFVAGETYLVIENGMTYFRPGSSKENNYYHIYLNEKDAERNNFGFCYPYKRECFVTIQEYRDMKLKNIGIK